MIPCTSLACPALDASGLFLKGSKMNKGEGAAVRQAHDDTLDLDHDKLIGQIEIEED